MEKFLNRVPYCLRSHWPDVEKLWMMWKKTVPCVFKDFFNRCGKGIQSWKS